MYRSLPLLLLAAFFCVPAAHATVLFFDAPLGLTGDQEFPAVNTPATGTGTATFDTDTLLLTVHLEWADLLAPAAAAHIHVLTPPNPTGPVAVDFVPAGFPAAVAGTFDHTFDLDDAVSYGATFLNSFGGDVGAARNAVIDAMANGEAYFNIHTPVNPGGEIRGNIRIIPEPASLSLLALGALAALIRRRTT